MRVLLAVGLFAISLHAQPLSFGIKAGVPLNEAFNNDGGKFFYDHSTGHWIVGPTAEIRLPFLPLSVEADVLFRRYTLGSGVTEVEIPILAKYRFHGGLLRPFAAAGPAFNYVTDPGLFQARPHAGSSGVAVGGGIELKALLVRISPELRYTHWSNRNIDLAPLNSGLSSKQNQIELLVGITF